MNTKLSNAIKLAINETDKYRVVKVWPANKSSTLYDDERNEETWTIEVRVKKLAPKPKPAAKPTTTARKAGKTK